MPDEPDIPHNKALQLTGNPLRGLSAAELGRYTALNYTLRGLGEDEHRLHDWSYGQRALVYAVPQRGTLLPIFPRSHSCR